ncbi:MAG: aminomethyl-transferring glycine dehydrogenase subunit GcvPA [Thermoplasmata archaeon]
MGETQEMLDFLGVDDIDELFKDIPETVRSEIDLPRGVSEMEVVNHVRSLLNRNRSLDQMACFLGAGIYNHYVPAIVFEILGRSEFYTSYTPYQAEVSQGMLQALFEYQSLICELTGMEASNTSMYDYPTALAEAVLMSGRIGKRKRNKFLLPKNIHWEKIELVQNYLRGTDISLEMVDYHEEKGTVDREDFQSKVDGSTLGFYVESPNFFGVFEDEMSFFSDMKEEHKLVSVAGVHPLALTLMEPPSSWEADIVVGDSQPLGIPPSLGGPTVGIFACSSKHLRRMPGRMIGETEDADGDIAYCMTLQTREQHIRRERATSNICTNQALMSLASAVYTFTLGGKGLEKLARLNYRKAHEVAGIIDDIPGVDAPIFSGEFFNEFVVSLPGDIHGELAKLSRECNLLPGINLGRGADRFADLPPSLLTAVTETCGDDDIDKLVSVLKEVVR